MGGNTIALIGIKRHEIAFEIVKKISLRVRKDFLRTPPWPQSHVMCPHSGHSALWFPVGEEGEGERRPGTDPAFLTGRGVEPGHASEIGNQTTKPGTSELERVDSSPDSLFSLLLSFV